MIILRFPYSMQTIYVSLSATSIDLPHSVQYINISKTAGIFYIYSSYA